MTTLILAIIWLFWWTCWSTMPHKFFLISPGRYIYNNLLIVGVLSMFSSLVVTPFKVYPISELNIFLSWISVFHGLLLALLSRMYLGKNWNTHILVPNELIDRGPYKIVRHPIYTGLIAAMFGTASLISTPSSWIGFFLVSSSWIVKLYYEEKHLTEELPVAYHWYKTRVPYKLVPKIF